MPQNLYKQLKFYCWFGHQSSVLWCYFTDAVGLMCTVFKYIMKHKHIINEIQYYSFQLKDIFHVFLL